MNAWEFFDKHHEEVFDLFDGLFAVLMFWACLSFFHKLLVLIEKDEGEK